MTTEYERKFRATPADLTTIDRSVCTAAQKISMETTYYDTPSGQFSARRYTLRRRLENGVSVCTLKIPAGGARAEFETENAVIENAIPELIAQGAPDQVKILAQEGLNPICGAKFTRIAKLLELDGAVAELALDHGYLFAGERKETLCEVELELKSGDEVAFDRYAEQFAEKYALQEEPRSKFARALKLYKGE